MVILLCSCSDNFDDKNVSIRIIPAVEPVVAETDLTLNDSDNLGFDYSDLFEDKIFTIPRRSCAYHLFSLGEYNLTVVVTLNATREIDIYFVKDLSSEYAHCLNRNKIHYEYAEFLITDITKQFNTSSGSGILISTKTRGDPTNITFRVFYPN